MDIQVKGPDGHLRTPVCDASGKLLVSAGTVARPVVATATVTRVAASATAVTLLAANANRTQAIVYNASTAVLRIKLGSAASATDYSYLLGAGDTYESPTDWVYTGIVTGIWDSATGAAQVTEI